MNTAYCLYLLIFVEFVACLHVVPLFFWMSECNVCWHYSLQKGKWKFWVAFFVFYTLYARGELGLRTHRLSDSCSFAEQVALAAVLEFGDGSQGKRTEDLTSTSVCEEFKTQRERSSVKQHTEGTKPVSVLT